MSVVIFLYFQIRDTLGECFEDKRIFNWNVRTDIQISNILDMKNLIEGPSIMPETG